MVQVDRQVLQGFRIGRRVNPGSRAVVGKHIHIRFHPSVISQEYVVILVDIEFSIGDNRMNL